MTIGAGTKFGRNNGSTIDDIAELRELGDFETTRETEEDTNFDSVDQYNEFLGTFKDAGELEITVKYKKGGVCSSLMQADLDDPEPKEYRIAWPDDDNTMVTFNALVTKMGIATPLKEHMLQSFTLKVSGKPIWA